MITRPRSLEVLTLITGLAIAVPMVTAQTFTVTGAAVRYRCWQDGWQHSNYEARREVAATYDHCVLKAESTVCLVPYGGVASTADGWAAWNAEFTTEISLQTRYSYGMYVGTELHIRGRTRDNLYNDAMPGGEWMSAGIAGTIQSNLRHWAIGEWNPPPRSYGCEGGSGLLAAPIQATCAGMIDNLFQWWLLHGIADTPFSPFAIEIGEDVAEMEHGRADVTVALRDNGGPYQPPTWTVCRERADITITIPGLEELTGRTCADLNTDGVLDPSDIFCFLSCWFEPDARGDWDGDGACSIADIWAYLSNYHGGA